MKRSAPFLLLHGFELALALALVIVGLIFTAFPEALEHAPAGFETRGVIHHIFHYTLLAGAILVVVGLVIDGPRTEMVGLILLAGAILINLLAVATGGGPDAQEGLTYAFRGAAVAGILARLYLIAFFLPSLARRVRE